MYVDDIFGVSLRKNLEYDMACARKTVTDLLYGIFRILLDTSRRHVS
jgi:hypothetical protein